MPSLSKVGWSVFCLLLLWERLTAERVKVRCSPADPLGAQHPVQALLERFQVGKGCAARERGSKETHVIAIEKVKNSAGNKVTVLLRPLSPSSPPLRKLHLVLSSKLPVSWLLEAEQLPPGLPVFVQVSANSSVQSQTLHLHVRAVPSLPSRLHALHRWALKHHGTLSSVMHTKHGNRVYINLGEDPDLPAVCQLQSPLICPRTTQISDLQPQKVQGCTHPSEPSASPEVYVIQLHSVESGLCGSPQMEVIVSLVNPVATLKEHKVVLILSSLMPVSWVVTAHGVQGHISVHSSSSVSPPFISDPNLTLSSTLDSELSTVSDLLVWASENGYNRVTSYTEADLANRLMIQLAEGGATINTFPHSSHRGLKLLSPVINKVTVQRSLTVTCGGGLLSVTVDNQTLQSVSVPVAAVTLQDQGCQALSNGSHFLLTLPVIFCGTEAVLLQKPRGVLYKNRVLLWKHKPQMNEETKYKHPLSINISCFAASPLEAAADDDEDNVTLPLIGRFTRGVKQGPESALGLDHFPMPRHGSGPVLHLKLFVTESYEQTWIGPCVITADQRVFVEISAKAPLADLVQVTSCFVSPLSDPKKPPFWTVISNGCSSDLSLTLSAKTKGDGESEEKRAGVEGLEGDRDHHRGTGVSKMDNRTLNTEEKEIHSLRFSFVLRPVFNESIQFLHCSLLLCPSDSTRGEPMKESVKNVCSAGIHVPPLVSRSPKQESQCELRNLSRPMVVTQPVSSLLPKVLSPAGHRTKRLSITSVASQDSDSRSLTVPTGPLMGIVFAAFMIGVSLMGGLWCIYYYTGRPGYFTDQKNEGHNIRTPPSLSDQSSTSV